MTDHLQQMRDDYTTAFTQMRPVALSYLDAMLLRAYEALATVPALPSDSHAALHLERLKKDIDALRATIEQIG